MLFLHLQLLLLVRHLFTFIDVAERWELVARIRSRAQLLLELHLVVRSLRRRAVHSFSGLLRLQLGVLPVQQLVRVARWDRLRLQLAPRRLDLLVIARLLFSCDWRLWKQSGWLAWRKWRLSLRESARRSRELARLFVRVAP